MSDLKKLFDASRPMYGHTSIEQAAKSMGYSKTTIDRFFANDLPYPDKVEAAIRKYISDAGIVRSIKKLGLDPNATKKKVATLTN